MPNGHDRSRRRNSLMQERLPAYSMWMIVTEHLFYVKSKETGMPLPGSDIPAELAASGLVGGPPAAHCVQFGFERVELVGEGLKLGARRDAAV